jgi:hypothetical protein
MKAYPSPTFTASGQVCVGQSVYYGTTVTVVTAVGAINIRKGSVSGQIIDVITSGTAVGTTKDYSYGIQMDGGIFIEFNGGATGSVVVRYET